MSVSTIAKSIVGTKLMRRAKFSWLAYGVGAYVALRLMRRYGMFGKFPDRALHAIEDGFESVTGVSASTVKSKVNSATQSVSPSASI